MVNLVGDPVIKDVVMDSPAAPELDGAFRVVSTVIDDQIFVYAAGRDDNGIQILQMDAAGDLTPIGSVRTMPANQIIAPSDLEIAEINGAQFLIVTSSGNDTVISFEIGTTGPDLGLLTRVDTAQDGSPDHDLDRPDHVETFDTAHGSFVAIAAKEEGAVFIYQVSDDGDMTLVDSATVTNGTGDLAVHTIGARTFLYVSGDAESSIATFEIADSGALTDIDELGVSTVAGEPLEAARVDGTDLLVTANNNGVFSVFDLSADGAPSFLSSHDFMISDGIEDLRLFQIVTINGATLILSVIGDGVGIFSLSGNGHIELANTVVSASDLRGATGLDYQEIDGRHFIIITASDADAVTTIEIGAGDDTVFGGLANDVLLGFGGNDTMSGGDGRDELYGGSGDDVLSPDFGADFVDGGDGNDTVNYSNTWAVNVRLLAGRATADLFRDVLVSIENIHGSMFGDLLSGDSQDNVIDGDDGDDRINGLEGQDILRGGLGNDVLLGGLNDDILQGGAGDDKLQGQLGNDTLLGDAGNDFLIGGLGRDTLNGGAGDDRLLGGGQADVFVFESGGGFDQIADWQDGPDKIDLTDFEFASFDMVVSLATQAFVGVQIDFDNGDVLQINGMTLEDLSANDFILA